MVYYVTAHDTQSAVDACRELQTRDLADCFISPATAICCLGDENIPEADKTALRLDLLTLCDGLVVVPPVDSEMQKEINLAKLVKMEVRYHDC